MSNLWRSGTEEKADDEVLGVLCGARDIAREMQGNDYFGHAIRLTLNHRCGARNECKVMCEQAVRICTCCVRGVAAHTQSNAVAEACMLCVVIRSNRPRRSSLLTKS